MANVLTFYLNEVQPALIFNIKIIQQPKFLQVELTVRVSTHTRRLLCHPPCCILLLF